MSRMRQAMMHLNESWRPTNTARTMDSKVEEIFQFLNLVYPTDPYANILDRDKIYRFMFYTTHRPQRPRGGTESARRNKEYFNLEEYREIVDQSFTGNQPNGMHAAPVVAKPIEHHTFEMYKACIRKIHRVQVAKRVNRHSWEELWTEEHDLLYKIVCDRTPMTRKLNYAEKVDAEFSPYSVVEHYPIIEVSMWKDSQNSVGHRSVNTHLRHRYIMLHLTSGILRSESLYRNELSDFVGLFLPQKETDIHPMYVMINQLAQGKTNKGRKLYGRATRHKDVNLCCVAALSFYLAYRFFCTNELWNMSAEDWCDNKNWFDLKLLGRVDRADNTEPIKNDTFSKYIGRKLQENGCPDNKKLHLGRNIGAKCLELLEEEKDAIKALGNWSNGMFENSYSAKLPIGPIRKLAGFHSSNKMYFNTRTSVEPTVELLQKGPFAFCYAVYDDALKLHNAAVSSKPAQKGHPTALETLKFFHQLNKFFIQDAAAMAVQSPDRVNGHPLFNELPVLQSEEFEVSSINSSHHIYIYVPRLSIFSSLLNRK